MKKLRFVSVIILLLLFCPFIKQCDGLERKAEEIPVTDSTAVVISNSNIYDKSTEPIEKLIDEPKEGFSNKLKTYFTEESENVFDLSSQVGIYFDNKKNEDFGLKGINGILFSILFSTLLIISSIIALIQIFRSKLKNINWFYIANIISILGIIISNLFVWLDRFGQIKIGVYLLLLSNFYMLYLLKQKKEQIQL